MRKAKVGHQPLPEIGEVVGLDRASGPTLTSVVHRSGRPGIPIGAGDMDLAPTAT